MPRETISTSTKLDSLLRENARLHRRVYAVEQALEEQQTFNRSFNAQLKLDLAELMDQINALQQALADAGVVGAYQFEPRTPPGTGIGEGAEDRYKEPTGDVTWSGPATGDTAAADTASAADDSVDGAADTSVAPPVSVPPPDEMHRQMYLDFSRGDYRLALDESALFLETYPDHPLGEEVRFIRGECFIEQEQYFDALNEFATILQLYPRGKKAPAVLLRMAISYEKIGENEIAAGVVKRLRQEYPYSEEAAMAEERFQDLLEE
jgi:TolA-binding protein